MHHELSGTKSSLSAELKALQAQDSRQQQQLESLKQELAHARQQQQSAGAGKTANLQQLHDEALQEVSRKIFLRWCSCSIEQCMLAL